MKRLAILIAIAGSLTACETVSSDGTVTRWDASATKEVIETGFGLYDRYRAYQQPVQPVVPQPGYYYPR